LLVDKANNQTRNILL